MKIWHISDTHSYHGLLSIPKDIDMIIHSGDASNPRDPYTNEHEVRNFIYWMSKLDIKYKVFVAGNHDTSIEKGLVSKQDITKSGIIYLENETVEIEGIKIFGSPLTPTFNVGWAFNKDRNKLERIWRNVIEENTDIVICHGPPQGMLDLSYDKKRNLEFRGDKSLMNRIKEINPQLVLFGHIHNHKKIINAGTRSTPELKTIFSNGSVVTDGKFGILSSNGNILEI